MTIADVLARRANEQPEKLAYGFLDFSKDEPRETSITYEELDRRSRAVAACLRELGASGENVLLLLDTGPDFLASFFGCLYAGAVAVPGPGDGHSTRLGAIAKDAGVRVAIGSVSDETLSLLEAAAGRRIERLRPDAVSGPGSVERARSPLAFLQYTSGTTGAPKGVMVSHEGLLHNLEYAARVEENDEESVSVSWLPVYHDMGLVEGILQPLYSGYPAYLFSPRAFLERPLRWLYAISRYRATNSGAPNFAYDLCVRKTTPEERRRLDLRSWRVAYNGAEPIRAETLRTFFEAFESCGFRWESFYPVYGLAESTLVVTSPARGDEPALATLDRVRVGCGRAHCGVKVEIVDPRRRRRVAPGEVGEIWVSSESNARGYWRRPRESRRTFEAFLRDTGEGPFLRTGDLGVVREGELFVLGRIQDVVVVRGRNYHPRDLEWTAEEAHPAIRAGGVVVFANERDDGAVLLAEVTREDENVLSRLRAAVLEEHGLGLDTVALVPPRTLLKTSSGKLRRSACRKAYFEGELEALGKDDVPSLVERLAGAPLDRDTRPRDCLDSLGVLSLAEKLGVSIEEVMAARTIGELGRRSRPEPATPELDARLPSDLKPEDPGPPEARAEAILVTGATGFLGAYLLRELLERTEARLFCLVRNGGVDRVRRNLESHGLWAPEYEDRLTGVWGDVSRPNLGLSGEDFERLAETLDAILHNAAAVNFVYGYRDLRDTNVRGTLEALRLAFCARPKRFHFVSTLGVLYTAGREVVSESTDALPFLSELHLGYAETKAVAESLVRQASERGLVASIYRLALLSGAESSGLANENDFLSRLLRGCVRAGTAPDLDVELDACPVDFASRAIASLMLEPVEAGFKVFHVRNEETRHFRELVLWMNLFGYSVALEPYRKWLLSLDGAGDPRHPLRGFFSRQVDGLLLPERYEEGRKAFVRSEVTRSKLAGLGIRSRRSSPAYLERCFRSLVERGALPEPRRRASGARFAPREWLSETLGREVEDVELTPSGLDQSILTEITSWYAGRGTGLYRASVTCRDGENRERMFLKVKPSDREVLAVARKVAELASPRLGAAFERFEEHLGFSGTHLRELALYQATDRRLRDHMPRLYGVLRDDANGRFVLALEELPEEAGRQRSWTRLRLEAVVRGLAAIHASGFEELPPALAPRKPMAEMEELWAALFEHARPWFRDWGGDDLVRAHESAVAEIMKWSKELESLPRTLVHNDFNPRNLFLRPSGELCAFDWELAALGPPQRDLAELLCFVLSPEATAGELSHYLELHWRLLENETATTLDAREFVRGFELALRELIVDRLPMYTLVHRFQKKPFLERVVPTWLHLARLTRSPALRVPRSPSRSHGWHPGEESSSPPGRSPR